MADEPRQLPGAAPPSEEGGGSNAGKRTVRVQLANGARELRAYVGPTDVPEAAAHKTFEMQTVAVDRSLDPRRRATVARGMGEAVQVLEGDIVDPETGEVLPPVGADPGPNSPWLGGKRPTKLRGQVAPVRLTAPTAGARTTPGSSVPLVAYLGAGAILVAGIVGAVLVVRNASRATTPPAASLVAPTLEPPARPLATGGAAVVDARSPAPPSTSAATPGGPAADARPGQGAAKPGAAKPGSDKPGSDKPGPDKAPSGAPGSSSTGKPLPGGRIF